MTDVFLYADETGDLDMSGSPGTSTYFGFGTATFADGHGAEVWEGMRLRCHLESRGIRLPRGMHAKNDSHATRCEVFDLIRAQGPRFDTTFLLKQKAFDRVRQAGQVRLYKLAWYLHLKEIARQVSSRGDRVFVIVGSLQTHNKRDAIRHAIEDVCGQIKERTIVPRIWDAPSAWGIQVADYALWATQRTIEGRACPWFDSCVNPTLQSRFMPWGQA